MLIEAVRVCLHEAIDEVDCSIVFEPRRHKVHQDAQSQTRTSSSFVSMCLRGPICSLSKAYYQTLK
jgi:hypothetical protein